MKTLHFNVIVQASRKAVWDAMLAPETYKIWTSEFMEGLRTIPFQTSGRPPRSKSIWRSPRRSKATW